MSELRNLTFALNRQRKRLHELVDLCGGPDPDHPLQEFSRRRIAWLENRIEEIKKRA